MFMYFYLLMIAGAFGNLVAGTLTDTKIPFGIIALTALGMLAGQMIYRWRVDIMVTTPATAYNLLWANVLLKITTGKVVDPGIIAGNTVMGVIALFLVVAALTLVYDGGKAMQALRGAKPAPGTAPANSVDPQASLSDIFKRDIFGKGAVEIMPNLYAQEIDADQRIKA